MSRSSNDNQLDTCESAWLQHDATVYSALDRPLTPELLVQRVLPQRAIRMIGPWCFLDHFGPIDAQHYSLFDVAPHPHIGLQTITWLLSGQLMHLDSLGYEQSLRPGQLNLMTAGRGISHAEVAEQKPQTALHGLQLWCALPPAHEETEPRFDHYPTVPQFSLGQCSATLITGSYITPERRWHSPALSFTPHLALLLEANLADTISLQLKNEFEYGIYVLQGTLTVDTTTIPAHHLLSLGSQRNELTITLSADCTILILGGEPFAQPVKIWWNFVSASQQRVEQAQRDWEVGHPRFGEVHRYRSYHR